MQRLSADSDQRMPATSPFELLADELGAVAGRVERETLLRFTALAAELDKKFAQKELELQKFRDAMRAAMAEDAIAWDNLIRDKLALIRDGVDGINGKDGKDGEAGPAGQPGQNGEPGIPGPQGLQGLSGPAGDRGEMGPAGKDGADGAPGIGLQGEQGARGERGEPGVHGLNGADGERGERGEKGDTGAPGMLPIVKLWRESVVHYAGEVCAFDGGLYQALQDTATVPLASEWICLATAGADGKDGVDGKSLNICGTYEEAGTYKALDVVTLDSKWHVAKYDNPGACPGPGWKSGPGIGKTGKPGPQGERGARGDPGRTITIASWETNAESYELVPVMSDGTRGAAVSVRELFEQYQLEAN